MDGNMDIARDEDGYLEYESYVQVAKMVRDTLPDGEMRDDMSQIIGALQYFMERWLSERSQWSYIGELRKMENGHGNPYQWVS